MTTTTPTRPPRSPRAGRSRMGRRLDPVTGKVTIPDLSKLYVAYWRDAWVLKVGRAWKESRLNELEASGAEIVLFLDGVPASVEAGSLAVLNENLDRAFTSKDQARAVIPDGTGYTECFFVHPYALDEVLRMIVTEGFPRYEHGPAPSTLARRADERVDDALADVGTPPRGRAESPVEPDGADETEPAADQAARLPVRRRRHPRQPDARRAHARRSRNARDIHGTRRPRALRDDRPSDGPGAGAGHRHSGFFQRTHSVSRERARGRERAGGSRRAAVWSWCCPSGPASLLSGASGVDGCGRGIVCGVPGLPDGVDYLASRADSRLHRSARSSARPVTGSWPAPSPLPPVRWIGRSRRPVAAFDRRPAVVTPTPFELIGARDV